MECKKCGNTIDENSKFCNQCGAPCSTESDISEEKITGDGDRPSDKDRISSVDQIVDQIKTESRDEDDEGQYSDSTSRGSDEKIGDDDWDRTDDVVSSTVQVNTISLLGMIVVGSMTLLYLFRFLGPLVRLPRVIIWTIRRIFFFI